MADPPPAPAVPTPHDAYVKSVFGEIPQAAGLFRAYLPEEIVPLFDWRTLRLEAEGMISEDLQKDFADLRFTIRFLGQTKNQRITLLFEHKDRPRYHTPRQLLRYISRQIEAIPESEPLPSVLTVVLLQSGAWNREPRLSSEYQLPDSARSVLQPYLLDFQMNMIQLAGLEEHALKGTESGRFALALLQSAGAGQPMRWLDFRGILDDLCRNLQPSRLHRELRRGIYYLLNVMGKEQASELRLGIQAIRDEYSPVKEHIMTLMEYLEKLGEERGEHLGKVAMLVRLLTTAYPEFTSADADRLRQAPDSVLDEVTDACGRRGTWDQIRSLIHRDAV